MTFSGTARLTMLFVLLLFLAGCSAVGKMPSHIDSKAKKMEPPTGKALVYIVRPAFVGTAVKAEVVCNRWRIGATGGKRFLYVILDPGTYQFESIMQNVSTLDLKCESGKTYFIEQNVRMQVFRPLTTLILLDRDFGEWKLKSCSLSTDIIARDSMSEIKPLEKTTVAAQPEEQVTETGKERQVPPTAVKKSPPAIQKPPPAVKKPPPAVKKPPAAQTSDEEKMKKAASDEEAAQKAMRERKMYIRGGFGGGNVKNIPMYMWTTDNKQIYIDTGISGTFIYGYELHRNVSVEVGLGYFSHDNSVEALGVDVYFKNYPMFASLIYHFVNKQLKDTMYGLYVGGGGTLYRSPELYRKGTLEKNNQTVTLKNTCEYKSTFAPHILFGGRFRINSISFYLELLQPFVKYEIDKAVENGIKLTNKQIFDEWKDPKEKLSFNIGMGYHF